MPWRKVTLGVEGLVPPFYKRGGYTLSILPRCAGPPPLADAGLNYGPSLALTLVPLSKRLVYEASPGSLSPIAQYAR
jgi:hypothetical protein